MDIKTRSKSNGSCRTGLEIPPEDRGFDRSLPLTHHFPQHLSRLCFIEHWQDSEAIAGGDPQLEFIKRWVGLPAVGLHHHKALGVLRS